MTREEAIAIIRKEYLCVDRDCDIEKSCGKCDLMMPSKEPILQAYKMAIKALEQEPCKVSEYDKDHIWYKGRQYISLRRFLEVITEPKAKWIPVSERLPKEKDGSVLVTIPDKKVTTARYSEFSDKWYVGDMMEVGGPDPLAWVPLPEPYKPQEREDEK